MRTNTAERIVIRRRFSGWMAFGWLILVFLSGCGAFTSTTTRGSTVAVDRKENGFLIELPSGDAQPQAEALVTRERWVIVTIVDPLYSFVPLQGFTSPHVDSLEYIRFNSAVQVSLRFRSRISEATVVSQPSDPSILVSVFQR